MGGTVRSAQRHPEPAVHGGDLGAPVVVRESPRGDAGIVIAVGGTELLDDSEEAGCGGFYEGADLFGEAVGRGGDTVAVLDLLSVVRSWEADRGNRRVRVGMYSIDPSGRNLE